MLYLYSLLASYQPHSQVLRCKLDPSLRVRSAAQRVLERLAPNVLADLACRGARGGASPDNVYCSTTY